MYYNRCMERKDTPDYRNRYAKGWRYAVRATGLDNADRRGLTRDDAWMDGYLDQAAGRERWHLLRCADHAACGQG